MPITIDTIVDRYNRGVEAMQEALEHWQSGDVRHYEGNLRSAALDGLGALEWALKYYLRRVARPRLVADDQARLRQPSFHDLVTLCERYADPPMTRDHLDELQHCREQLRNVTEHEAATPARYDLAQALRASGQFIETYITVPEGRLRRLHEEDDPTIDELRKTYEAVVQNQCEFMDLRGISPRVGSKVVSIRMSDLFVPLSLTEGEPDPEYARTIAQHGHGEPTSEEPSDPDEAPTGGIPMRSDRTIDVNRLLSHQRVVILGDPGSGKTTLTKYIAYQLAVDGRVPDILKGRIPILLKAAEYGIALRDRPDLSFYGYIVERHSDRFGPLYLWSLQRNGACVLIDGLDEIADTVLRVTVARRIERFVTEFPQCRIVVTSRIVGYRQSRLAGTFLHAVLSGFSGSSLFQVGSR